MTNFLNHKSLLRLAEVGSQYGFGSAPIRNILFAFVNPNFFSGLELIRVPRNQVLNDLLIMDREGVIQGGEFPLLLWLESAIEQLRHKNRTHFQFFEEVYEAAVSKSQQQSVVAFSESSDDFRHKGVPEQIVIRNDMLPYTWLAQAHSVGRSVAQIAVPRFEGNQPVTFSNGQPRLYYGSSWLIGSHHVITNHHVVNARSGSEGDASSSDLRLQAMNARVRFDFEEQNDVGVLVDVADLVAWSSFDETPQLDYAILRLAAKTDRPPLRLAPRSAASFTEMPFAVNIIQHPLGGVKMLGIRNNLIHRVDKHDVTYFTDTQGGSSGAPVCDDQWNVIALHKGWKKFHKDDIFFQGQKVAWENKGTLIQSIIDDLVSNHPSVWDNIAATLL